LANCKFDNTTRSAICERPANRSMPAIRRLMGTVAG
jgi:hypothetical protein